MNKGESINLKYDNVNVKFTKVKDAQEMGEYKETLVDKVKNEVDFRLISTSPYTIIWNNGTLESLNKRKLTKLQKEHTWTTDF